MSRPIVLRIYKSGQLVSVKQFTEEQIVIGRPEADVQLSLEEGVSPIHAAIEKRDQSYFIFDLGSESGTFRNGAPILDEKLEHGDVVKIGSYTLEFYEGVPKPKMAPPKTGGTNPAIQLPSSMPASSEEPYPGNDDTNPSINAGIQVEKDVPLDNEPTRTVNLSSIEAPSDEVITAQDALKDLVDPRSKLSAQQSIQRAKAYKSHQKSEPTYAPPSSYNNVKEFVKPSKGTVVEVLVAWKERIISTSHFSEKKTVTVGPQTNADIHFPLINRKFALLKIDSMAIINVPENINGELIKGNTSTFFDELIRQNRLNKKGKNYIINLEQGEMVKINLTDDISIIVRYVSHTPRPMAAPFFDLTGSEFLAVVLSVILSVVIALYNFLYTPGEGLNKDDEPPVIRTALIITDQVKRPKPTPAPKIDFQNTPPKATPTPVPKLAETKATPIPKANKRAIKKAESPKPAAKRRSGRSARSFNRKKNPGVTSIKKGGAKKTGPKKGAQAKSQTKDVTKSGIFSVFGGGGRKKNIDKAYTGAGELAGFADKATGSAGQNEDRAGEELGTRFKDTGSGGRGQSNIGISGVQTKGRAGGRANFGDSGLGTGGRKSVKIVPGGEEEEFRGTIDREAIRRVVLNNSRSIKLCYERELNRNPSLFGKLVLEWDIGEQGRVLRAKPRPDKSTIADSKDLAKCVISNLKTWRFPEPPRNEVVTIVYPFLFTSR